MAQEPLYTQHEKNYMHSKFGIKVVDDPEVFAHIDRYTLVVAIAVPDGVLYDVSQHELPAAMIAMHPGTIHPGSGCNDSKPASQRTPKVTEMFRQYNEAKIVPLQLRINEQDEPEFPPNAFGAYSSLWVKKGDLEELGPADYVATKFVAPNDWKEKSRNGGYRYVNWVRSE